MLTGKQRSYLKGLANGLDVAVYIGKNGLSEQTLREMDDYLAAHELVKVKLQDGAEADPKDAANDAASALHAEFVQAIGKRFVLYRRAREPEKRQIALPR